MRLRGWMGLGALVMGAVACGGESVGPPAVQSGDLVFDVPAAGRSLRTIHADRELTGTEAALAASALETRYASDEGKPALILDTFLGGEYSLNELWLHYGMFSAGTGYTLGSRIKVQNSYGETIDQQVGEGRKEDQGIYSYQHPDASDLFLLPAYCGAVTAAYATFEVRSTAIVNGEVRTNRQTQNKGAQFAQAKCTDSAPTGGGTVSTVGTASGFKICYYEVWTDLDGNVITWNLIGCSSLDASLNVA